MQVAVETRSKEKAAGQVGAQDGEAGTNEVKEDTNLKLVYQLDNKSKNYDSNADEHRINEHMLKSELVDTCG